MTSTARPRTRRRIQAGLLAAAVAALFVGLGWLAVGLGCCQPAAPAGSNLADQDSTPDPAVAAGAEVGAPAPPIQQTADTGQTVRIPAGKPAVLYFFAPGCANCLPPLEAIAAAQTEPDGQAAFVAINVAEPSAPYVEDFLRAANATTLPTFTDTTGGLTHAYQAYALGTTVITDTEGTIRWRGIDPDAGTLHAALESAEAA